MNYKRVKISNDISWTCIDDMVFVFSERTKEIKILKGLKKDVWFKIVSKYNYGDIGKNTKELNLTEIKVLEEYKEIIEYLLKEKLIELGE